MSITIRLWTENELQNIHKDKWLATIFMNVKTFTENEIRYYPYKLRRTYIAEWVDEPGPVTIYATDEKMLLKFIDTEYDNRPDSLHQKIIQYRSIDTKR